MTHRSVATEAGTSVRATTYYFTSRDDMLAQALEHYAETAIARFDALSLPPESLCELSVDPIDGAALLLAEVVRSDLGVDRTGLVAEYELLLEVGRRPGLEAVYRRWQGRLEQILADYAAFFGSADPAADARLVLATLRGLELEALGRPSQELELDGLVRCFSRLLRGLFVGPRSIASPPRGPCQN